MLDDVVAALRGAGVDDVRVLAGDDAAAGAADGRGLTVLPDPGAGLRAAVDAGLAVADPAAVRLVVAADLPALTAPRVATLLAAADRVTVLPTPDGGTAVLLLPPGVVLPARYGPGSAALHAAAARDAGLDPRLLPTDPTAQDVDGPADLAAAVAAGVGPSTAATLRPDAARGRA